VSDEPCHADARPVRSWNPGLTGTVDALRVTKSGRKWSLSPSSRFDTARSASCQERRANELRQKGGRVYATTPLSARRVSERVLSRYTRSLV